MFVVTKQDKRSQEKSKPSRTYLLWSFILFILVFSFVIYYFSEIRRDFLLLGEVNPLWLALAILGQFITYVYTAVIYRVLLRPQGEKYNLRLRELIKASVISLFFNQTMPSAGISGNAFFLNFLLRVGMNISAIINLIITELLIFYAAMEIIIISLLCSVVAWKISGLFKGTLIGGAIVYVVFASVVVLAGRKKLIQSGIQRFGRIKIFRSFFDRINGQIAETEFAKHEINPLLFISQNRQISFFTFCLQVVLIAVDAFTVYALFSGLGVSVSPFLVMLCFICTKIISILPFLPGALLLYESSMTFFFVSMGVVLGNAIVVTLLYRLLSFWAPMPIGFFLYHRWAKKAS